MILSRRVSGFLLAVAAWNWVIWVDFARRLALGEPRTAGFVAVHSVLIGVSLALGSAVGVVGWRGWRAARSATVSERALRSFVRAGRD